MKEGKQLNLDPTPKKIHRAEVKQKWLLVEDPTPKRVYEAEVSYMSMAMLCPEKLLPPHNTTTTNNNNNNSHSSRTWRLRRR